MCVCVCYSSRLDAQRPERQRDKFRAKPREGCVFFVCFGYLLMNPHNSQVICMWGCQCKCNADRAHKTYTHMYVYIYCTGGVTGEVVVFCHVCTSRHARAHGETQNRVVRQVLHSKRKNTTNERASASERARGKGSCGLDPFNVARGCAIETLAHANRREHNTKMHQQQFREICAHVLIFTNTNETCETSTTMGWRAS